VVEVRDCPPTSADMGGPDTVSGFSGSYWGHTGLIARQRLGTMWTMEAQIYSIAVRTGGFLTSPLVWATLGASFLALVTGFAARVAVLVEDLRSARVRSSSEQQYRTTSRPSLDRDSRP
jgi:hypothetical protein